MPDVDGMSNDPADEHRRIDVTREQRDWVNAAAAALEQHADEDEDPHAMSEAARELRDLVAAWDASPQTTDERHESPPGPSESDGPRPVYRPPAER